MTELLFRDDAYLKTATARVVAVDDGAVELDRTIFYPLGGGQPGDTGFVIRDNGERIAVTDTRKGDAPGTVAHLLAPGAAPPQAGETVGLEIDWERRYALMRLHTALHVMSCVVVAPVTGGNIAPDKARLDFDIDIALLDADRIAARHQRADRARRRDRDRLDHGRGARRAARARQDDERAAAARRGARAAAADSRTSTCSPAAARTSPTSPRSAASACCASATKASATSAWRSR